MAIKTILQYPDPRLRIKAEPVTSFDDNLASLVQDMFETMYAADGVGLAATQVDVHRQVIVMDMGGEIGKRTLINPSWVAVDDALSDLQEGCLSVPGYYDQLPRHARVMVRYFTLDGTKVEEMADGLYALCIQHEYDHLQGKVFVDDLSNIRKQRAFTAMAKRKKEDRKKMKKI